MLPGHPFRGIEGTVVSKASLHYNPLPHILNVDPEFSLAGRELWEELCWQLAHWQQACRGNVTCAFARLSFAFPFVVCEYTKVQRMRIDPPCPL